MSLLLFIILCLLIEPFSICNAQYPTYTLTAKNFRYQSISFPSDAIEFDIYVRHTNPPVPYYFTQGQYYFTINSGIFSGNYLDTNESTYRILDSDFPNSLRPRNPSITTGSNPSEAILRLAINFPPEGDGYEITNNGFPGTKIVKMRLRNKLGPLNPAPLNLQWRNPPLTVYATRLFAYVNTIATDITTPSTHYIDTSITYSLQLSPLNNQSCIFLQSVFKWKKLNYAVKYKFFIFDDFQMNNVVIADTNTTDTIKKIFTLNANRDYYWKVIVVDSMLNEYSSELWRFKTIDWQQLYPNNSFNNPFPPLFKWRSLIDVNKYSIEVSSDSTMNNIVFKDTGLTETSIYISALEEGRKYFWRLKARDSMNNVFVSPVWNFKSIDLQINPPYNTFVIPPMNFYWHRPSHSLEFDFYTAYDSLMQNPDIRRYYLEDTLTHVTHFITYSDFFWKIFVRYAEGIAETPSWRFSAKTFNLLPLENEVNVYMPVNFKWNRVIQANNYILKVGLDSMFNFSITGNYQTTDTFFVLENISPGTKYFWKIEAMNGNSLVLTSSVWSFTTGSINYTTPKYNLVIKNIVLGDSLADDDMLKFDIYIQHTNDSVPMKYINGQYFISFNNAIASGIQDLEYSILDSDLPAILRPRNPSVGFVSSPPAYILRLGSNTNNDTLLYHIMTSNGFPGTRIVKMRLRRLSGTFNNEFINLAWRNPPAAINATKLFAFVGDSIKEITTPATHLTDSNYFLPVELADFSSFVSKNDVTLIWMTSWELNNRGFKIERLNQGDKNSHWEKAGYLDGAGNSIMNIKYIFTDKDLETGIYKYRIIQSDFNGIEKIYELEKAVVVGIPDNYMLHQNYPNPFNPVTKIEYDLPENSNISIKIYDVSGKLIKILYEGFKPAGYHNAIFEGSNLSGGIYFCRFESERFSKTIKIVFLK